MHQAITTFTFTAPAQSFQIRVIDKDGEPWFVASDVCRALDIGNSTDAVGRLDDDERTLDSIEGASNGLPINLVSEAGLYSLILGSRKPEAKPFKRWVTHEVLPAIARTGVYVDSRNQMGEALGAATDDALRVGAEQRPDPDVLATIAKTLVSLEQNQRQQFARTERQDRRLSELMRGFATQIAYIKRVSDTKREPRRSLDPNRPLSPDEIEKFKYLVSQGASAKQLARSLHRTHEVIHRFIEQNQELVTAALRRGLL